MCIDERYMNLPIYDILEFKELSSDVFVADKPEPVLHEHLVDIYVNGILTMKVVCLAEHLAYMVLGRLLTEGMITSAENVEHIYVSEDGKKALVSLKRPAGEAGFKEEASFAADTTEGYVEITPTSCTSNHVLTDFFVTNQEIAPLPQVSWKKEWILELARSFETEMPLYSKTRAAHSCILARRDQILFTCEDLGRHNALDKAIGYAITKEVPLDECILYTSGRVPTDMALKAIRAGVPVLASKTAPTVEAVELARRYGLTLICFAKGGKMQLFSGRLPE